MCNIFERENTNVVHFRAILEIQHTLLIGRVLYFPFSHFWLLLRDVYGEPITHSLLYLDTLLCVPICNNVPICNKLLQIWTQLHYICVTICNNVLQIGTLLQIGAQNTSLHSLILQFQRDIRMRKYILHRWEQ